MPGIFGGHIFAGLGQTTAAEDTEFRSLISSLASRPATTTTPGGAIAATTTKTPTLATKTPTVTATWPGETTAVPTVVVAPADNTLLYVVGGVAVVGVLAALMMSRRGVAANRKRWKRWGRTYVTFAKLEHARRLARRRRRYRLSKKKS